MLLEAHDIRFTYDDQQPPVLDGVSVRLGAGQSLAIVGPSGSGKSTLLNILGTLERPTAGTVLIDGQDVTRLDERALATVRNRRIGFIFQEHHLLPQCTLLENVLIPTLAGHGRVNGAAERARSLLNRVGLTERAHHRPGEVSGGQRQRAAVVRALINRPALLLADEPTGSLDRASAENLAQLLVELNEEEQVAMVLVTHSADLAARMKKTATLDDGELHDRP